jgi:hypothetical protein
MEMLAVAQFSWVMICGLLTLKHCCLLASNFPHGNVSILWKTMKKVAIFFLFPTINGRVRMGGWE